MDLLSGEFKEALCGLAVRSVLPSNHSALAESLNIDQGNGQQHKNLGSWRQDRLRPHPFFEERSHSIQRGNFDDEIQGKFNFSDELVRVLT